MIYILAILLCILLCVAVALNILSLPGNWIAIALLALWAWLAPGADINAVFFIMLIILAAVGELLEFLLQSRLAKRSGSSSKGNWAGLLGAILGAILGASFLFGLGALPGALIGAYAGCLIIEMITGRPFAEARRSAWGAMTGKFAGLILKITLGLTILVIGIQRIWL